MKLIYKMQSFKSYTFTGLTILFLLFASANVMGQEIRNIEFNHLTSDDGLSQSSVFAILQDSEGYMWFGTNDGLNKYNGYEMTVYKHNPEDSSTVSGNNISYIYEDKSNNIWIGTTGAGLNRLDKENDRFFSYRRSYPDIGNEISNNSISSILEDSRGRFWVGTDQGLNRLNRETGKFEHFFADSTETGSLSSNMVTALYDDSEGNLWIGTKDGLNLWDPESRSFRTYSHNSSDPSSISHNHISVIYEDSQGVLWIGTGRGLNRFNRDDETFQRYQHDTNDPNSLSGNSVFSILEDSRGILWVGTENNGLNAYDRGEDEFYHYTNNLDNPRSISDDAIYTLYENDDNILWIGTYSGGLSFADRKQPGFEHYQYDPYAEYPLSSNSVTAFLEDSRGNIWVGTDGGGLNRFDRETGEFHTLKHNPNNENSLTSNVVLALLEDSEGYLWIGYYRGGISRYNPGSGTFQHFTYDPDDPVGVCQDNVFVLYEDRDGDIWAGTNGNGVCEYNPDTGEFTQYQALEGVIRDIYEDPDGTFWLGTYGGGLKILDRQNGNIRNFYEGDDGLRSNVVLTIHVDRNENFWIGTSEGGLHHFDRENQLFTPYNEADGLPSNIVKGILEDDQGDLWLSTNNGISRFDPELETFTNYGIDDGLQGREFNTLAYYKDNEGYMYFGGINGFNRFHPDSLQKDTRTYPVVFSDFKIFNKSIATGNDSPLDKHISQTRRIELPHTATVLTFDYAALNFNKIKEVRYAYKMEGFEADWNYVDNRRTATYTNLAPGEYTLRVRTTNNDGTLNDNEAAITLVITPPVWQTTWFYILSALFVAGLVFGGYQYRVRKIRSQNRYLASKIAERTSELDQKNRELEETLHELHQTKDELVENAHKAGMADIAAGVLHNVGNILNSVNTSSAIIEDTLNRSQLDRFTKANDVLRENKSDLKSFIAKDSRAEMLLKYYLALEEPFKEEREKMREHIERLDKKIKLINEIIAAQQTYATSGMMTESVSLPEVIEDALTLQAGTMERHNIKLKKELGNTNPVKTQKTKLVHVLVNIIKNAKEAMIDNPSDDKVITFKTWQDNKKVYLRISDNGSGVHKKHINKIFTQGFTTKESGHGFGLHSSANYISEMGGNISVESDGEGMGTTFIITLPRQ